MWTLFKFAKRGRMILRQLLHREPVIAASYVLGCVGSALAAVCDPIDDPHLYVRHAQESNVSIRYVIDTHLHADHVSGGRKLAEISGAEYVLHESADTQYACRRVKDGELLELGNVRMQL